MARTPVDSIRIRISNLRKSRRPQQRHAAVAGDQPQTGLFPTSREAEAAAHRRKRRPSALRRLINAWWTRLLTSIYQGSLGKQEAEYEEHATNLDYIWNTVGTSLWGFSFPLLTIVATQLAGAEEAGMFSLAFVTGTLLMIACNYGVRNHQVSDIDEEASFASYQLNRWICGAIALIAGLTYSSLRGYDAHMATISLGVYLYKAVDGIADVYEGRLQQADKLYLGGISQTVRSAGVCVVFSLLLLITRDMAVAAMSMGIAAIASLVLLTIPLALLESEKSRRVSLSEVARLFARCLPMFGALFLFNLIESMPKFIMEGALPYKNQLYFNALYFPAQGILLAIGFVYKPQLVRLSNIWANPRKRRRFDLIIVAVMAMIVAITVVVGLFMGAFGIQLMNLLYGLDFEKYRMLAYLMVVAGGITAAIDFLYAIITVLRRAGDVTRIYLICFAASVVLPLILVNLLGLMGAVVSYVAVMALLLALLMLEYVRIRQRITRERNPFH